MAGEHQAIVLEHRRRSIDALSSRDRDAAVVAVADVVAVVDDGDGDGVGHGDVADRHHRLVVDDVGARDDARGVDGRARDARYRRAVGALGRARRLLARASQRSCAADRGPLLHVGAPPCADAGVRDRDHVAQRARDTLERIARERTAPRPHRAPLVGVIAATCRRESMPRSDAVARTVESEVA